MNRRDFFSNGVLIGGLGLGCSSSLLAAEPTPQPAKYPVVAEADVLVCGGGSSGVAAAVSAARHGAKVVLLERLPSIGGMGTNALVNGLHCSDRKKKVIFGLVEEFVQRAAKNGWADQLDPVNRHETCWFNPEGVRIVWQKMLREAGVRTFCYLTAGEPVVEDGRIKGVLSDTKTGRKLFTGKIVIDCTGDGDIAVKSGIPFEFGRVSDGLVQGMTMCFTLRGIDSAKVHAIPNEKFNEIMGEMAELHKQGKLPPYNVGNTGGHLRHAANFHPWNMCPAAGNPLDEEELTRLTEESRERVFAYVDFWKQKVPGMENAAVDQTACALGIRESRRVKGRKTLTEEMVLGAVKHPDAVGHGVWMIDIHDPKGSGYTTYTDRNQKTMLEAGTSYHIPLGMAFNDQIPNLAVACRAASSTHEAHSSFRVQSHLMTLAQGVGTCAAMALRQDVALDKVDVKELQKVLKDDGVYLEDVPA